jgi:hypothetical protein
MRNRIEKKILAALVAIIAAAEHTAVLWYAHGAIITEQTRPYPDDMQIAYGIAFVLCAAVFGSVVSACALYFYSQRTPADAWERVLWTGLAMALSPWSTSLLLLVAAPLAVPTGFMGFIIGFLVGIIAPYAFIAARLRRRL